jgi:hypothetical protein
MLFIVILIVAAIMLPSAIAFWYAKSGRWEIDQRFDKFC